MTDWWSLTYWAMLVVFGLMGTWHAISPQSYGQEWRNALAAFVLYVMLILIGLRYFML